MVAKIIIVSWICLLLKLVFFSLQCSAARKEFIIKMNKNASPGLKKTSARRTVLRVKTCRKRL